MLQTNVKRQKFRPAEGFYTSELPDLGRLPMRTFLPTGYEPNYPYPLLVFFHGHGGNEEQILKLAPRVSRRNYIAIGLRGLTLCGERAEGELGYTWGRTQQDDPTIEDYVFQAIEETRRNYHVHSERIYLAGICEGATMAYRLGLTYPEKFGGIISLNGSMTRPGGPLFRFHAVRELRAFIGHGIANAVVPLGTARSDYRLLYATGLDVEMKTYATTHRLHPEMLRDVNRWIIENCEK